MRLRISTFVNGKMEGQGGADLTGGKNEDEKWREFNEGFAR